MASSSCEYNIRSCPRSIKMVFGVHWIGCGAPRRIWYCFYVWTEEVGIRGKSQGGRIVMVGMRAAERNPALALLPMLDCKGSDIVPGFIVPLGFAAHLVPATTQTSDEQHAEGTSADDPDQIMGAIGWAGVGSPGPGHPTREAQSEEALRLQINADVWQGHAADRTVLHKIPPPKTFVHRPPEPRHWHGFAGRYGARLAVRVRRGKGGCRGQVVCWPGNPCWSPSSCGCAARRVRQ